MAQAKFKVGELVITQHATYFTEYDGSLGVVIRPLRRRLCKDLNLMQSVYGHVYGVRLLVQGEPSLWYRPWQLRKLGDEDESKYRKSKRVRKKTERVT